MDNSLEKLLNYCENIIDVEHYEKAVKVNKQTMNFEKPDSLCLKIAYTSEEFKPYSIEEIHEDMGKMMYNEIISCLPQIETKDYGLAMIRANYGVGTLASAFGAKSKIVDGNMPWVEHMTKDSLREITSSGVPAFGKGFDQKLVDTYEFYRETLSKYPKCSKVIKLYHPDFQGPLDVAHLMYGSDIYMDMYMEPELVHDLIDIVADTYIDRMKKIKPLLNDEEDGFCYHWLQLFCGNIVLRNDSAVNISADMYKEFVQPYDNKIMKALGKATMHFCGRADHWVLDMAQSEDIIALNFGHMPNVIYGQEYLDFLYPQVMANKKPLCLYVVTEEDLDNIDLNKYGTGISYSYAAKNKAAAERMLEKYR